MGRPPLLTQAVASGLSLLLFADSYALSAAEANFWKDRRSKVQLASVAGLSPVPALHLPRPTAGLAGSALSASVKTRLARAATSSSVSALAALVPVTEATIRDIALPESGPASKVVLHLQDVHLDAEAQGRLGATLGRVLASRGAGVVGLEGSSLPIDLTAFRTYPDREAARIAADFALRSSEIPGPVHALITAPGAIPPVQGVDDDRTYAANVAAYRRSIPAADAVQKTIEAEIRKHEARARRVLNPKLLAFHDARRAHDADRGGLGAYLRTLKSFGIALPDEASRFLEALAIEESLDTAAVEAERSRLISRLVPRLSRAEADDLVRHGVACRLGEISTAEFHEYLRELCRRQGVELSAYPAFDRYVRYVLLSDRIDGATLFDALEAMEERATRALATTVNERAVMEAGARLSLVSKLSRFALTPREWLAYKNGGVGRDAALAPFESFYIEAEKRDALMASNMLAALRRAKATAGVLVTGGFHSTGLSRRLTDAGVAVIAVTPRLTKVSTGSGSESLGFFAQEKAPLETLFRGDKLFLSPPPEARLHRLPLHMIAARLNRAPATSAADEARRFSWARPVRLNATRESDGTVIQQIATPGGAVEGTYEFHPDGSINTASFRWNPIPEILTAALMVWTGIGASGPPMMLLAFLAGSLLVRFVWTSAFLAHGFGHVAIRALIDGKSGWNAADILEGSSLRETLLGLAPFAPIYTPGASAAKFIPETNENRTAEEAAAIAAGGPLANLFLLIAAAVALPYAPLLFSLTIAVNLAFLLSSRTDFAAVFTGVPFIAGLGFGYGCGIMFVSGARRESDTGLFPPRFRHMVERLGRRMLKFGSHGFGGALTVEDAEGNRDFIHEKLPAGVGQSPFTYNREGPDQIADRFFSIFDTQVENAEGRYVATDVFGFAGHARYTTAPGGVDPSLWRTPLDTTQGFYMDSARFNGYSAANGDFNAGRIPGRLDGPFYEESEWGEFFSRMYGVPVSTNDSHKAAYFNYFLVTKGSLVNSLRLAYVMTMFEDLKSPLPSDAEFQAWASRLDALARDVGTANASGRAALIRQAVDLIRNDSRFSGADADKAARFVTEAFKAFQENDAYQAAKIFIELVDDASTFGFFFQSTLEPGKIALLCRTQPVAIGRNATRKVWMGGSNASFVDWTLKEDEAWEASDRVEVLVMKMGKDESGRGGEIAEIDLRNNRMKMYRVSDRHEFTQEEIAARWEDVSNSPAPLVLPRTGLDSVEDELNGLPLLTRAIDDEWSKPAGRSPTVAAADKFAERLIHAATQPVPPNRPLAILFVTFRQEQLNTAVLMKELYSQVFPWLRNAIDVVDANKLSVDPTALSIDENTNVVLMDIGLNFPVIRFAEELNRRVARRKKMDAGDLVLPRELPEDAADEWKRSESLDRLPAPNVFIMQPGLQSNISRVFDDPQPILDTKYFPEVDGSIGMIWTQLLTHLNLLMHTAGRMREKFKPGEANTGFGMKLTKKDLAFLRESLRRMAHQELERLTGRRVNAGGELVKVEEESAARRELHAVTDKLEPYFTEQPRAMVASIYHLGLTLVATGSVVSVSFNVLVRLVGPSTGPVAILITIFSGVCLFVFYQFFKWGYVLILRWREGRPLWHRDATPAVTFFDDTWNGALFVIVSKMWAFAKGFVSPSGFYNGSALLEGEGKLAHLIRRGSILLLSVYANIRTSPILQRALEGTRTFKRQAQSHSSIFGEGPNIVGIGDLHNGEPGDSSGLNGMKLHYQASLHTDENRRRQEQADVDNPDLVHYINDLAFNSPVRMLAQYVVFEDLTRRLSTLTIGGYHFGWPRGSTSNSLGATTRGPVPPAPPVWEPDFTARIYRRLSIENGRSAESRPDESAPSVEKPATSKSNRLRGFLHGTRLNSPAAVGLIVLGFSVPGFFGAVLTHPLFWLLAAATAVAIIWKYGRVNGASTSNPFAALFFRPELRRNEERIVPSVTLPLDQPDAPAALVRIESPTRMESPAFPPAAASVRVDPSAELSRDEPFAIDGVFAGWDAASDEVFASGLILPAANAPEASALRVDQVEGSGTMLVDDAGRAVQIAVVFPDELGRPVTQMTNYSFDADGRALGFIYTESVAGVETRRVAAIYTAFDAQGRPTVAEGAGVIALITYDDSGRGGTERMYFEREGRLPSLAEIRAQEVEADREMTFVYDGRVSPLGIGVPERVTLRRDGGSLVVHVGGVQVEASSSDGGEDSSSSEPEIAPADSGPAAAAPVTVISQTTIDAAPPIMATDAGGGVVVQEEDREPGVDPRDVGELPRVERDAPINPDAPVPPLEDFIDPALTNPPAPPAVIEVPPAAADAALVLPGALIGDPAAPEDENRRLGGMDAAALLTLALTSGLLAYGRDRRKTSTKRKPVPVVAQGGTNAPLRLAAPVVDPERARPAEPASVDEIPGIGTPAGDGPSFTGAPQDPANLDEARAPPFPAWGRSLLILFAIVCLLLFFTLPFLQAYVITLSPAVYTPGLNWTAGSVALIGVADWFLFFMRNVILVLTLVVITFHLLAHIPVTRPALDWISDQAAAFKEGTEESAGLVWLLRHIVQTPIETMYRFGFRPADDGVRRLLEESEEHPRTVLSTAWLLLSLPFTIALAYIGPRVKMLVVGTVGRFLLIAALTLLLGPLGASLAGTWNPLELFLGADAVHALLLQGGVLGAAVQILSPFAVAASFMTALVFVTSARGLSALSLYLWPKEEPADPEEPRDFWKDVALFALGMHFVSLEIQCVLGLVALVGGPLLVLAHRIEAPTGSVLGAGHDMMERILSPLGFRLGQIPLWPGSSLTMDSVLNLRWQAAPERAAVLAGDGEEAARIDARLREREAALQRAERAANAANAAMARLEREANDAANPAELRAARENEGRLARALEDRQNRHRDTVARFTLELEEARARADDARRELAQARERLAQAQRALERPVLPTDLERALRSVTRQSERDRIIREAFGRHVSNAREWNAFLDAPRATESDMSADRDTRAAHATLMQGAGVAHSVAGSGPTSWDQARVAITAGNIADVRSLSRLSERELRDAGVSVSGSNYEVPIARNSSYVLPGSQPVLLIDGKIYVVRMGARFGEVMREAQIARSPAVAERRADLQASVRSERSQVSDRQRAVERAEAEIRRAEAGIEAEDATLAASRARAREATRERERIENDARATSARLRDQARERGSQVPELGRAVATARAALDETRAERAALNPPARVGNPLAAPVEAQNSRPEPLKNAGLTALGLSLAASGLLTMTVLLGSTSATRRRARATVRHDEENRRPVPIAPRGPAVSYHMPDTPDTHALADIARALAASGEPVTVRGLVERLEPLGINDVVSPRDIQWIEDVLSRLSAPESPETSGAISVLTGSENDALLAMDRLSQLPPALAAALLLSIVWASRLLERKAETPRLPPPGDQGWTRLLALDEQAPEPAPAVAELPVRTSPVVEILDGGARVRVGVPSGFSVSHGPVVVEFENELADLDFLWNDAEKVHVWTSLDGRLSLRLTVNDERPVLLIGIPDSFELRYRGTRQTGPRIPVKEDVAAAVREFIRTRISEPAALPAPDADALAFLEDGLVIQLTLGASGRALRMVSRGNALYPLEAGDVFLFRWNPSTKVFQCYLDEGDEFPLIASLNADASGLTFRAQAPLDIVRGTEAPAFLTELPLSDNEAMVVLQLMRGRAPARLPAPAPAPVPAVPAPAPEPAAADPAEAPAGVFTLSPATRHTIAATLLAALVIGAGALTSSLWLHHAARIVPLAAAAGAWILAHPSLVLFWALWTVASVLLARLFKRQWSAASLIFVIAMGGGALLLWWSPAALWMSLTLVSVGAFIVGSLSRTVGLMMWSVVSVLLGWLRGNDVDAKSRGDAWRSLLTLAFLAALAWSAVRGYFFLLPAATDSAREQSERFPAAVWPAAEPAGKNLPEKRSGGKETGRREERSFRMDFKDLSPLVYEGQPGEYTVPLYAHQKGQVKVHPDSGIDAKDYRDPNRALRMKGGQKILRLNMETAQTSSKDRAKLIGYLRNIDARYRPLYSQRIMSDQERLRREAAYLLESVNNYEAEQAAAVFGDILAPFPDGETGYLIPEERPVGEVGAAGVLLRGHSAHRLHLRMTIPLDQLRSRDISRMKVWISVGGVEIEADTHAVKVEPHVSGALVTVSLYSARHEIFSMKGNAPVRVSGRIEVPPHEASPSYSHGLSAGSVRTTRVVLGERKHVPLHPTGVAGRVTFGKDRDGRGREATWAQADEPVAEIAAGDRARLEALADRTDRFIADMNSYLGRLRGLIARGAAAKDSAEAKEFQEHYNEINRLMAQLRLFRFKAPFPGLLVDTFNAENQPFGDRTPASILTPLIQTTVVISKDIPVVEGDVVIVRRSFTGQETLAKVRSVRRDLPNRGGGQDMSRMQEVTFDIHNVPFWFSVEGRRVQAPWLADREFGIEVDFVPGAIDAAAQAGLRERYEAQAEHLRRIYAEPNLRGLPRVTPYRFVEPSDARERETILALLHHSAAAPVTPHARPAMEGWPEGRAREQRGESGGLILPSDDGQVKDILRETNPEARRRAMEILLTNKALPFERLERVATSGHPDVAQMALNELLRQRRIEDLVRVHKTLSKRDPDLDRARLARAHVLELIESGATAARGNDPLARLVRLEKDSAEWLAAQEFFLLTLQRDNAASNPATAIAVRRILESKFWRSHEEMLRLAADLEKTGRGLPAANLLRNAVFARLALQTGWSLGEPQQETAAGTKAPRYDTETWGRLRNLKTSDEQDRLFLEHSPEGLNPAAGPERHFKGRIRGTLYDEVLALYKRLSERAQRLAAPALPDPALLAASDVLVNDHVFVQLNLLGQRDQHVAGLNLHALERFLLIMDRPEAASYREQRELVIKAFLDLKSSEARLILARAVIHSHDPALVRELIQKGFDRDLAADATALKHELKVGGASHAGDLVIYQQALAKLAGAMPAATEFNGRREVLLRAALATLSDFELTSARDADTHTLRRALDEARIPASVTGPLIEEEINRRAMMWAIGLVREWSHLTYQSQIDSPVEAILGQLVDALEHPTFDRATVERILLTGLRDHQDAFDLLKALTDLRLKQIEDGEVRDAVSHLETSRAALWWVLGPFFFFFGLVWALRGAMHRGNNPAPSDDGRSWASWLSGWLPKLMIWMTIGAGALFMSQSPAQAAAPATVAVRPQSAAPLRPAPAVRTPPAVKASAPAQKKVDAVLKSLPPVRKMDLASFGKFMAAQRAARAKRPEVGLWEIQSERHIAAVRENALAWQASHRPGERLTLVLMAAPGRQDDQERVKRLQQGLMALRSELARRAPSVEIALVLGENATTRAADGSLVIDPAKALQRGLRGTRGLEVRRALRERRVNVDLFVATDRWTFDNSLEIDGSPVALNALLSGASIHWLDVVKGVLLSVPVERDVTREFERLRRAHEALGRSA